IIPSGHKADPGSDKLTGIGAERSRDGLIQRQFAQRPHQKKHDHPADDIGEQECGPRQLDRLGRTQKKADSNGPSDGNQLDMTMVSSSGQFFLSVLSSHSLPSRMKV